MTEAEWWGATEPKPLLEWLFFDVVATDRKLRLYSIGCCNRIRHLVNDVVSLDCLDVSEAYADELTSEEKRLRARSDAWEVWSLDQRHRRKRSGAVHFARAACQRTLELADTPRSRDEYRESDTVPYVVLVGDSVAAAVMDRSRSTWCPVRKAEVARQVFLLHDIFGPLPFRDVTIAPEWGTSDVLALAQGIYDEKAFDRMPILADALQDAGCDNAEVLDHCRAANWEHVRGCWVIDLLLGRPWREASGGA